MNKKLIVAFVVVGVLAVSLLASAFAFGWFKKPEVKVEQKAEEKQTKKPKRAYKYAEPGKEYDHLYLIKMGRYGYINKEGEIVIKPKYIRAGHFTEGLAPACPKHHKCGFINTKDEFIIEPKFSLAESFSEGLAAATNEEGLTGYIDKTGKYVIQPDRDFILFWPFKNGTVAKRPFNNKYMPCSYYDINNHIIFDLSKGNQGDIKAFAQVDYNCKLFSDGLLLVGYKGNYAYIDRKGEIKLKFLVRDLDGTPGNFSDGLIRIKSEKDKKWSYVDKKGKEVIPPQFTFAADFSDGYAAVSLNETLSSRRGALGYVQGEKGELCKLGYINKNGDLITETKFCMAWPFKEGLAYVGTKDKFGYINTKGKFIWSGGDRIPWFIFRY